MSIEAKFKVKVQPASKKFRIPKEMLKEIKNAVGRKMLQNMKKESVICPVMNKEVPFVVCFLCPNFIRRVKGFVYCKGNPLQKKY